MHALVIHPTLHKRMRKRTKSTDKYIVSATSREQKNRHGKWCTCTSPISTTQFHPEKYLGRGGLWELYIGEEDVSFSQNAWPKLQVWRGVCPPTPAPHLHLCVQRRMTHCYSETGQAWQHHINELFLSSVTPWRKHMFISFSLSYSDVPFSVCEQ